MKILKTFLYVGTTCLVAGLLAGCSAPKPNTLSFTTQSLKTTDATKIKLSDPFDSEVISNFEKFNADLSTNNVINNLGKIYSADLYFRDPFKEIHGLTNFQAYLLKDSDAVAQYDIDWQDVGKSDGDYYFRWVMSVKLKRDSKDKPPVKTCGVSHVRFGADGKVIYEQDIFDAAAFLYEQIPVLGGEIRFIKKRL